MGLRARLRRRVDVWQWRLRYWWLDTESGRETRVALLCLSLLVSVAQFARMAVVAALPPPPGEPAKSVYWWVVQLIIAVVSAIISYAMRPKPQPAKAQQMETPTVEPGKSWTRIHGDVWTKKFQILAHRVLTPDPIKKGGKK